MKVDLQRISVPNLEAHIEAVKAYLERLDAYREVLPGRDEDDERRTRLEQASQILGEG